MLTCCHQGRASNRLNAVCIQSVLGTAGNWSEQLLKSMYQVTWHHASAFPQETGQLWITVAANKRNVIPILDFVITQGLQEATELPEEVNNATPHQ